jgi:isoquinoline 1-oxidoreductase beta subunit
MTMRPRDAASSISRREFVGSAGVLVVGLYLWPSRLEARGAPSAPRILAPNAFVRVGTDDTVTVIVKHTELGQGPMTGLTTLVAEEMDADWSQMRAEQAPANAALYNNLNFGPMQATGGSSAVANSYDQMRQAGAAARAMLVLAAANAWSVSASEIVIERGTLRHAASGRSGRFGQFTEAAAALPVPATVRVKSPSEFRLIGKEGAVKKIDVPDKTNGKAQYGMDIHEPGMLTVVVAHGPRFGSKVASFDARAALAVKGVTAVKQLTWGVAVYADSTWAAITGRGKLQITWDDSSAEQRGTEEILDACKRAAMTRGPVAATHGDVDAALARAGSTVVEAEYLFPYLAHAPMEPLDGFLVWDGRRVKARFGSQIQTLDQRQLARIFGVTPADVEIETMLVGGSFGRRIDFGADMLQDLGEAAKAIGPNQPVKVVRTREEDIRGGFYRPLMVHRLRGAIANGKIVAWSNTIAGQSLIAGLSQFGMSLVNGIDPTMTEGASELLYETEHFRCEAHIIEAGVPVSSWRSVGSTHTGYAVECFVDELLQRAGQDPVAGRLALMAREPRAAGVLRAVAALANWSGSRVATGRARGVAVVKSFGTYVAEIAEVSIGAQGEPRVHKVWCAVDCGVAVNPDVIRAQMEGGIGYGLGAVLFSEVTMKDGRVVQSNFNDYRTLRINEMPEIEVTIVTSAEKPTGVGEPGVPPIGPAVANALARLGRTRPRRLPMVRVAV